MTYLLFAVSKLEKDDNLSVTIVDHDDRYILIKNLLCRLCLGYAKYHKKHLYSRL